MIWAQGACAGSCCSRAYRVNSVLGEVYDIRKEINRLYVIEDNTRAEWDFFVHTGVLDSLNKGDRVRVYFQSPRMPVVSVKKMTPVEYKEDGQNQGYLYKGK